VIFVVGKMELHTKSKVYIRGKVEVKSPTKFFLNITTPIYSKMINEILTFVCDTNSLPPYHIQKLCLNTTACALYFTISKLKRKLILLKISKEM